MDDLVVLTNFGIIIVTAGAIISTVWCTVREDHRHEEHQTDELSHIIHEVLEQEKAMEADRHAEHEETK
jgi:hypothetical protein